MSALLVEQILSDLLQTCCLITLHGRHSLGLHIYCGWDLGIYNTHGRGWRPTSVWSNIQTELFHICGSNLNISAEFDYQQNWPSHFSVMSLHVLKYAIVNYRSSRRTYFVTVWHSIFRVMKGKVVYLKLESMHKSKLKVI